MAFEIDLRGKTVIITGVTSGIGLGIAKMYAKANAFISGCGLEDENSKAAHEFTEVVEKECGNRPLYKQTDVTNISQLELFVEATGQRYGTIDILASNAGTNIFTGAQNCQAEDWLYNINLNLKSHWNIAKLCYPYLAKETQGIIIINSSCHAFNTLPGCFPYNIAKAGLKALVQSLTLEWSPQIRTVGVAPGFIDTQMAKDYFNTFADPQGERERTCNLYPLKRLGTTEEIGGWFVFLASEYAAFSAGQTYLIDGGNSAKLFN